MSYRDSSGRLAGEDETRAERRGIAAAHGDGRDRQARPPIVDDPERLPNDNRSDPSRSERRTGGRRTTSDIGADTGTPVDREGAASDADVSPRWDPDLAWLDEEDTSWNETAADDAAPAIARPRSARARTARGRGRTGGRAPIAIPQVTVPRVVKESALVGDRVATALGGVALFSVAAMAATLSNRLDALGPALAIHVDAAGFRDRWAAPETLWRLPLLALMVTLMATVVAWFVAPVDRFAARFVLAAALVVQLLTWVALGDFIL